MFLMWISNIELEIYLGEEIPENDPSKLRPPRVDPTGPYFDVQSEL